MKGPYRKLYSGSKVSLSLGRVHEFLGQSYTDGNTLHKVLVSGT